MFGMSYNCGERKKTGAKNKIGRGDRGKVEKGFGCTHLDLRIKIYERQPHVAWPQAGSTGATLATTGRQPACTRLVAGGAGSSQVPHLRALPIAVPVGRAVGKVTTYVRARARAQGLRLWVLDPRIEAPRGEAP
ncbi:hypothetical protein C4D60_Mb02t01230 [Musa balbisiana]|uniref:Uncharacterized protein n=1 Tax=Musa balbisiana TaxID=52838 RepID=A0A4S8I7E3_MUSBA|nr:hypothetical protein C4D60_Mb02t01230 [Musa balbisiana]